MRLVTLTTDFGLRDPYVAEMKGAILSACPQVRLIDVTHEVAPGDVGEGSWVLARVWERFPPQTVHVAVVDPGVGSTRLPVAVRAAGRWFVGPDNGIVGAVLDRWPSDTAVEIEASRLSAEPPSDTFHGRDLFAPAAARLACGESADALGDALEPGRLVRLEEEGPARAAETIRGHIVHVDRFGNLVTDIPVSWLPDAPTATIAGRVLQGIEHSYVAVPAGGLLMTRGSGGTLEISARGTSAAAVLGVGRGESVVVSAS
jgi:S-adenosylmethionine hydrolase